MKKLRSIFGGKPAAPAVDDKNEKMEIEIDSKLYLEIARQLGKESESIRTLVADAEQKISDLDVIRAAIGKEVQPYSKILRELDATKSELAASQARVAMLECDGAQLRDSLAAFQQKASALESANSKQSIELTARRAEIADLQARVKQQASDIQTARDENRRLTDRVAAADKQVAQMQKDSEATRQKLDATQQKLMGTETDRVTVQKALDKAVAELSQMSARVRDLDTAFDVAKQKHEIELNMHKTNYEALKTRADQTNKLLEDTRNSMIERAKEIQSTVAA